MTDVRPCIKPTEQRRKTADAGFSNANINVASTSKGLQSAVTQNSNKNENEMNANANIASTSSGLQLITTAYDYEPMMDYGDSSSDDNNDVENLTPNSCSRMPMLPLLSTTVKRNIPFSSRGAYRKMPEKSPQNSQNKNQQMKASEYILQCIQSYKKVGEDENQNQ